MSHFQEAVAFEIKKNEWFIDIDQGMSDFPEAVAIEKSKVLGRIEKAEALETNESDSVRM